MLLSNQLMEPLFDHRAVSLLVNVDSVCGAWLLSIDRHAKPHGGFLRCRSHDKMKIAGVKAVCYQIASPQVVSQLNGGDGSQGRFTRS